MGARRSEWKYDEKKYIYSLNMSPHKILIYKVKNSQSIYNGETL